MNHADLLTWREFERDLRTAKRSPRTIQSYNEAAEQLAEFTAGSWCEAGCDHATHDGATFEDMTKAHVQDYLLTVLDRHSTTTAANRFRSLRRFFNWMVRREDRQGAVEVPACPSPASARPRGSGQGPRLRRPRAAVAWLVRQAARCLRHLSNDRAAL
ncbi:phage integrase N-terminal SAM-like domain-containing protein [Spirillospora sp. NBC_01491]|uniref:phage integrase N-terminal SAM-like domain-containing protein n=1 Tax=Spirillospora sp. NBC_01491 TaxID=2976007 RepID=UPI002E380726|nr:phage integrase N-terminal SAM-like domain-containing protein [Spirillospora sp. NBC_01491]